MSAATTSVRVWVAPPLRKKRRRTEPRTTTSSPATKLIEGGGSNHATGTDEAPPSPVAMTSIESSWLPDASVRTTGSPDKRPRMTTTFMNTPI